MASPRERAASIATARFSFTFFWPMNSARRCGRSFNSKEESSPTGAAETRRSRLGSAPGLFLTEATVPDGRTKCEGAQFPVWISGRSQGGVHLHPSSRIHAILTELLPELNRRPLGFVS